MPPCRLVIVGIGGHGREIHDIVLAVARTAVPWHVLGFLDDAPGQADLRAVDHAGSQLLGGTDRLHDLPADVGVVLGVGDARTRRRIDQVAGERWAPVLVHPAATVGSAVELGPGTVVWAGARLSTMVRTGRHTHVNHNSTVGHDTVLADFATLHPSAVVSGSVRVGRAATIGANAFVRQGLSVGEEAFVGACAAVVRDVAAHVTVKGVPAC